jgi:hypothetical protein
MSGAANKRPDALRLQAQGLTKREIAARLGISVFTVSALVRSAPRFRARSCALCGERFVPNNGRQRYCCPEHRVCHRLAMLLELQCPQCGGALTRPEQDEPEPEREPEPVCREPGRRPRPTRNTVAAWTEYIEVLEGDVAQLRDELEALA